MKIKKEYGITYAKKYSDGSIVSVPFNTVMEITVPDSADRKHESRKLFKQVVESVKEDIEERCAKNKIIADVVATVRRAHKREEKIIKTEKTLQDFD